jgi:hypothetical protein
MKFPVTRVECVSFQKPAGHTEFSEILMSNGALPQKVYLWITDTDRFLGNYALSPFRTTVSNLVETFASANGMCFPTNSYKPVATSNFLTREYVCLMKALGYWDTPFTNGVTLKDFVNGYTLLGVSFPVYFE